MLLILQGVENPSIEKKEVNTSLKETMEKVDEGDIPLVILEGWKKASQAPQAEPV